MPQLSTYVFTLFHFIFFFLLKPTYGVARGKVDFEWRGILILLASVHLYASVQDLFIYSISFYIFLLFYLRMDWNDASYKLMHTSFSPRHKTRSHRPNKPSCTRSAVMVASHLNPTLGHISIQCNLHGWSQKSYRWVVTAGWREGRVWRRAWRELVHFVVKGRSLNVFCSCGRKGKFSVN